MSRFRMVLTGLAVIAGAQIFAGVAQAAPSAPATAPAAHQAAVSGARALTIKTAAGTVRVLNTSTAGKTIWGCPYGDVCMYTASGWNSARPEHYYAAYACYPLKDELGMRWIINNQYGGALVTGYYNYGCTNAAWEPFKPSQKYDLPVDITPVNSIKLYPRLLLAGGKHAGG